MIRIRNLLNGDIRTKWRRDFYDAGYGPFVPFGALGGDPSPVINWDFLQSQSLTSFSRTSNATLFDSTGKLTYALNNLLLNTATLATQTVTTGLQAGVSVILSFSGTGSVAISGGYTGSLAGTGVSDRVSLKFTTTTNSLTFTVTGSVTSAQLEVVTYQTTPSTYTATTTSPYYGPRYPYAYNGSTWDAQGLLVEAAGTNLQTYSNTPSQWTFSNGTLGPNNQTSPDGTVNASTLTATATDAYLRPPQVTSITAGAPYTASVFLKGSVGVTLRFYEIRTLSFVTVTCDGTFQRVVLPFIAVVGGDAQLQVGGASSFNSGSVIIYGFQVETGSTATSYIPNLSTGTTTRNADTSLAFSAISLPTGLSFSRASNAMQYDAAGRLTYAPNNLLTYSNTFSNGAWSQDGATISNANAVSDPFGGTQASTLTAASGNKRLIRNAGAYASVQQINSIWIRRRTGTGTITFWNPDETAVDVTSLVSSNWTQIYLKGDATVTNYFVVAFGTVGDAVDIYAATTSSVTYETVARPCDQVITTTSAYYGPRYDYDPTTRLPKGLLVEEGRTNVLTYSQTFATDWTDTNITRVSTTRASPDGTGNALEVSASAGNATIIRNASVGSSAARTLSIWMRRVSGTGDIQYTLDNGSNWTTQAVTTTWARYSFAATTADQRVGFRIVTSGDAIQIWGAQLEAGSFPTSYIPNPGIASGIRSADVATWTSAAISSYYNKDLGSAIVEVSHDLLGGVNNTIFGSSTNGYNLRHDGTRIRSAIRGVVDLITSTGPVVSSIPYRAGGTYQSGGSAVTLNGGAVVTSSTTFTASSAPTGIGVGYDNLSATNYLNGHIRKFAYYNVKLTDAKLQQKSVVGATL